MLSQEEFVSTAVASNSLCVQLLQQPLWELTSATKQKCPCRVVHAVADGLSQLDIIQTGYQVAALTKSSELRW